MSKELKINLNSQREILQEGAQKNFDKAADFWKKAIRLAPNKYIKAQNWLKITGNLLENEEF